MKKILPTQLERLIQIDVKVCAAVLFCVVGSLGIKGLNLLLPNGFYVPYCISHDVFHLYCPFCGCTRSGLALLKFDVVGSFVANPLVVLFCLAFICYNVVSVVFVCKGRDVPCLSKYGVWVLSFLLLFTLIRNVLMIFFGIDTLGELAVFWNK